MFFAYVICTAKEDENKKQSPLITCKLKVLFSVQEVKMESFVGCCPEFFCCCLCSWGYHSRSSRAGGLVHGRTLHYTAEITRWSSRSPCDFVHANKTNKSAFNFCVFSYWVWKVENWGHWRLIWSSYRARTWTLERHARTDAVAENADEHC